MFGCVLLLSCLRSRILECSEVTPTSITASAEFNNICMGQNEVLTIGPGIKGEVASETLKVLSCVFTALSSASEGGAIFVSGFTSTVEDTQFQDCFALSSGGAIRSKAAGITVRRCVFQRSGSGNGGAMQIGANNNAVVIEDNKFEACYGVGTTTYTDIKDKALIVACLYLGANSKFTLNTIVGSLNYGTDHQALVQWAYTDEGNSPPVLVSDSVFQAGDYIDSGNGIRYPLLVASDAGTKGYVRIENCSFSNFYLTNDWPCCIGRRSVGNYLEVVDCVFQRISAPKEGGLFVLITKSWSSIDADLNRARDGNLGVEEVVLYL